MKIAITHDYLIDYGGAERVLEALHEIYSDAPVFVSIVDKNKMGKFWKNFENMKIKTSWFNSLPYASRLISPLRFLLPAIWGSFDLKKYDVIIDSSSWAITRGFKDPNLPAGRQVEICYCHTPPRYLYGFDTSRKWDNKWYGKLIDIYALIVNRFMRRYDFKMAQKVDHFIANSNNTAKRIEDFYGKNSTVIYPPVEMEYFKNPRLAASDYYLTGGRFVAAKNFDLIIKACKASGVKLKIFGSGILKEELKKISNNNIEFLGKVEDVELVNLYANAKAFILAQKDEDFGMTSVESQAAGCPVIAYRGGGYVETVIENKTGIFFDDLTVESINKAINKFQKIKIKSDDCKRNAKRFSKDRFKKEIKAYILSHA